MKNKKWVKKKWIELLIGISTYNLVIWRPPTKISGASHPLPRSGPVKDDYTLRNAWRLSLPVSSNPVGSMLTSIWLLRFRTFSTTAESTSLTLMDRLFRYASTFSIRYPSSSSAESLPRTSDLTTSAGMPPWRWCCCLLCGWFCIWWWWPPLPVTVVWFPSEARTRDPPGTSW